MHATMRHVLVLGVADVGRFCLGHWYSLPFQDDLAERSALETIAVRGGLK
jgi:hypothetical protein